MSNFERHRALYHPQPVRALLVDDCIETGTEFAAGGARYNWGIPIVAGIPNVVDSLAALREAVFGKREVSAVELLEALESNFAEQETLRQQLGRRQKSE